MRAPTSPGLRPLIAVILVTLLAGAEVPTYSMTVNLARPYSPEPSRPRSADMTFSAPGHDDFLYTGVDAPVIVCQPCKRGLSLRWSLSHNGVTAPLATGEAATGFDNAFRLAIPREALTSGFYDVAVDVAISDSETLHGTTTFGWRIDAMPVLPGCPADFKAFWQGALRSLDGIAPEPRCEREKVLTGKEIDAYNRELASLPGCYDPQGVRADAVEVYRVRFASYGGKTIEGWFTKPVGEGPFPALLILPGAGNNARPAPVEHARHGYAALDIQVYGNPVDAPHYDPPPADHDITSPLGFQHYGIYLHALQAARVLKTLPGVDRQRLAVIGGSQGGRLTLVVAALDPDFKAGVAAITHFAYQPWLRWVTRLNAKKANGGPRGFDTAEPEGETHFEDYLDPVNFASLVRCPILMNSGLADTTSPPTGVFAAYKSLPGRKQIVPLPNTGHDWSAAFDRYAWRWLAEAIGQTAP